MFKKKIVKLKYEKIYKLIRNISLGILIIYFILYINKVINFLEFYIDIESQSFLDLIVFLWIILIINIFIFIFVSFRLSGMKIINTLISSTLISFGSNFILFFLIYTMMCTYKTNDIIYINKTDNSKTIEIRDFNCGALDSDLPKYIYQIIYDFPPFFFYGRTIDTNEIDKSEWISLKFDVKSKHNNYNQLDFREYGLINNISDSSFKVIRRFEKMIDPNNEGHIINDKQWFCTVHKRKYFYRSYVYQSHGSLILCSVDYENSLIDNIELYCDNKNEDYNLKKTSYFENDSVLILNKYYETFELDSNKKIIPETITKVSFKNRYLINYEGEIKNISGSRLGEVEIEFKYNNNIGPKW